MMRPAIKRLVVAMLAWVCAVASTGVHAAYVDNGDGTVTDTVTRLMWDKCPYGQTAGDCSADSAIRFTWANALVQTVALNGIHYKGYNDWRMPSVKELESLVRISLVHPAIDDVAFPNTDVSHWYWSSTLSVHDDSSDWAVNFQTGDFNLLDWTLHANDSFLRVVRGGAPGSAFDLLAPRPASMGANAGATPQSAIVGTAFGIPLGVTVKDAGNNPVAGVNVTFTAPGAGSSGVFSNGTTTIVIATTAAGVAAAPFTANAIAGGPYTVAAAVAGLPPVDFALTNTVGAPATMTANAGTTPQSTTISTAFATPLGVTVKDAGNNPVSGVNVTFTAPGAGASGMFSNGTATIVVATNASGVAAAPFSANAVAGGPYAVIAAAAALAPVTFALTNTVGAPATMTANAGTTPQSATVGTAFATALGVTVKDAGSNPVAGINVTFTAPGGGASGIFSNATTTIAVATNASGVAVAPFTANATAGGPYTVVATAAGLAAVDFMLTNTAAGGAGKLMFSGPTATGTGIATVTMTTANGGPACGFTAGAFVPVSSVGVAPPAGALFPQGLVDFQIGNCATTGISVTVNLVFPQPLPPGTVYWKYGPATKGAPSSWYVLPGATVAGNRITFTLTDGQQGDDDWSVNGVLADPGGPGLVAAPSADAEPIPVTSGWASLTLLIMLIALLGAAHSRSFGSLARPPNA